MDPGTADALVAHGRFRPNGLMQFRAVCQSTRAATADALVQTFPTQWTRPTDFDRIAASPAARVWLMRELGANWNQVRRRGDRVWIGRATCLSGDVELARWMERFDLPARGCNNVCLAAACRSGSPEMVVYWMDRNGLGLADALTCRALVAAGDSPEVMALLLQRFSWPIEHACRCSPGLGSCQVRSLRAWPVLAQHFGIPDDLAGRTQLVLKHFEAWKVRHLLTESELQATYLQVCHKGQQREVDWLGSQRVPTLPTVIQGIKLAAAAGHNTLAARIQSRYAMRLQSQVYYTNMW
jgi:hypothetical protein